MDVYNGLDEIAKRVQDTLNRTEVKPDDMSLPEGAEGTDPLSGE